MWKLNFKSSMIANLGTLELTEQMQHLDEAEEERKPVLWK